MDENKIKEELNTIIWQAPEYEYIPKDVSWHWFSIIIGIILIAFSIWQENFLFAIFIGIAVFIVNIIAKQFPSIWEFKIDEKGVSVGLPNSNNKKFYFFKDLESFDIHEGISEYDEYKELILKTNSKFSPFININFFAKDEERIKNFLLKFILKAEHPKSFINLLTKVIGF